MDPERLKRIKQICFDEPKRSKRMASTSQDGLRKMRDSVSNDSIKRLQDRFKSRNKMIEEKLNQSSNAIQRQPSQLLKQAGAYRMLRKSQNREHNPLSPSFEKSGFGMQDKSTSLVLQADSPTPNRSMFQNMRDKSQGDKSQDSGYMFRSPQQDMAGMNMVQKLRLMSKSRSRSRSGN